MSADHFASYVRVIICLLELPVALLSMGVSLFLAFALIILSKAFVAALKRRSS